MDYKAIGPGRIQVSGKVYAYIMPEGGGYTLPNVSEHDFSTGSDNPWPSILLADFSAEVSVAEPTPDEWHAAKVRCLEQARAKLTENFGKKLAPINEALQKLLALPNGVPVPEQAPPGVQAARGADDFSDIPF